MVTNYVLLTKSINQRVKAHDRHTPLSSTTTQGAAAIIPDISKPPDLLTTSPVTFRRTQDAAVKNKTRAVIFLIWHLYMMRRKKEHRRNVLARFGPSGSGPLLNNAGQKVSRVGITEQMLALVYYFWSKYTHKFGERSAISILMQTVLLFYYIPIQAVLS